MSQLLTKCEYEAIARQIEKPENAFIDGKFVGGSGGTFATINPATGETIAQIALCNEVDVDRAVRKAREAFDRGEWSQMHPSERKKRMIRLVKFIKRNRRELAVLESLESGKPVKDCEEIDIPEAINCLAWHAETADKIYGQTSPSGDNILGLIVREPIGVVACVLPWNFPLMMLAWKLGPALAAGNSVIIKPSEETSMTALRIADLAVEAGVPSGVISVLTGPGEITGQAIGLHPGVNAVSFTGSTEIGRRFLEYSAKSNLKRIVLECGGKSPTVVLEDAEQYENIARNVVFSAFWNMGQNCTSNSRLIIHRSVKDKLIERVIDRVRDWRTGDPLDPANALGAMVTREHSRRVMGYIDAGKREGAKVILGGEALRQGHGNYIAPTIFDGVSQTMTIAREEIFGPVLSVLTANSDEEAIEMANDTSYGLHASLYTGGAKRAVSLARRLQAGTVSVNCYSEGDITTPFGGFKLSGFGGRDKSFQAHEQYTETKTIWYSLSDDEVDREGA